MAYLQFSFYLMFVMRRGGRSKQKVYPIQLLRPDAAEAVL